MSEQDRNRHKARYYSGKKPYLIHNYRTMMKQKSGEEYYSHELAQDPMSELLRPYLNRPFIDGFEWEYHSPPGNWPTWPPWEQPDEPIGGCQFVCNPTMLDCEGGCSFIACICGTFLAAAIAWDDTGEAYIGGITETGVIICVGEALSSGTYPTIGVTVFGDGDTENMAGSYTVEVGVVDCEVDVCCDPFTIVGSDTVNPGTTWVGTISPACPGATCTVVSNSGCSLGCTVNVFGNQVSVPIGATDCGSFTVTVDDAGVGCTESASKVVRINNTSQGGSWFTVGGQGGGCPPNCNVGCTPLINIGNTPCVHTDGFRYGSGNTCIGPARYALRGCASPHPSACDGGFTTKWPPCGTGVPPCPTIPQGSFCLWGGALRACLCCHTSFDKCAWSCSC